MSEYIDIYIDTTTKVPEDATEFDYELFERFMSGGPWVAHSEYMKLKDDNAKLREELESVGTAAYLYGRSDLKADNAKLREQGARLFDKTLELATENSKLRGLCKLCEREAESAKLRESVNRLMTQRDERLAVAEADNAKLRELVRDLYEMAYPEYPSAFEAAFADRMHELGIEVDE